MYQSLPKKPSSRSHRNISFWKRPRLAGLSARPLPAIQKTLSSFASRNARDRSQFGRADLGAELVYIRQLRARITHDHPALLCAGLARVEAVALFALARYLHRLGLLTPFLNPGLERSLVEVYQQLLGSETGLLPPSPCIPLNKRTLGGPQA